MRATCSWAFGIWVLVYALQGAGTIYQLLPHGYAPDGAKQRIVNSIGTAAGLLLLQSWLLLVAERLVCW